MRCDPPARYIAIADGVDTLYNMGDDSMPIKNIFNEYHVKETSKKVRMAFQTMARRGERLATRAPYGYKKDPENRKKIVVDEASAAVVRHIFDLCIAGKGPSQIARQLEAEKVYTPSMYEYMETGVRLTNFNEDRPYGWASDSVSGEDYIGNTINCKYTTLSYKHKKRIERPENEQMRIEHSHEPIIDEHTWKLVQELRSNKRRPKKMDGLDKYSGLLFCEDCGLKMYFMRGRTIKPEAFCFVCSKYHKHNTVEKCTPHTIRSGVLDTIVLAELNRAIRYARSNKEQFIEAAMQKSTVQARRKLAALQ
ncbi:MAG: recombinase family protein, partial [Selenomonadales bacterium]|nr:recombinase family protein [Selenomonadales bacterium]